jgi:hypothetical protein
VPGTGEITGQLAFRRRNSVFSMPAADRGVTSSRRLARPMNCIFRSQSGQLGGSPFTIRTLQVNPQWGQRERGIRFSISSPTLRYDQSAVR